jgi:LCP family protein required for cell wall assembly
MSAEPHAQRPGGRHPHVRRTFLALSASLSLLVVVVSGVAMGTYYWTQGKIRVIQDRPPASGHGSPAPPVYTGKCARTSCNYLLLGSDSRAGLSKEQQVQFGTNQDIGGSNRSDTIILVHTQPDRKRATFVSFPRDLWVNIPGVGFDKINAAFAGGINHYGAQKVAETVHALTGIRIDHILYVDLAGFEGLVNALGGVDMCVPYPMQDPLTGLDIKAGCQHFDGATALAYVRTRHQPCDRIPDFARIARQQQFLRAILAKMLRPGELLHLPSLIPSLLRNVVVDRGLNPAELDYLAGQLAGVSSGNADFRVVPTVPAWEGSLSVVKLVEPEASELFARLRRNRPLGDLGIASELTPPSPAVIAVGVFDRHSGGVAQTVLDTLTKGGFDTSTGLAPASSLGSLPRGGSAIYYDAGASDGKAMADVVFGYLSNLQERPAPTGLLPAGMDVAVVIGATYQLPPPNTTGPTNCATA